MERNQKNIEKPKKTTKNNIWKLLVGPPPIPKTSGILFVFVFLFFFGFLDAFVGLCQSPPSPRPLEYFFLCCFILFFVSRQNRIVLLNHFKNHSIPVGKCMLFCKIESILELLQHGFEKSAILLTHSLKHVFYLWKCRFLFARCATLL